MSALCRRNNRQCSESSSTASVERESEVENLPGINFANVSHDDHFVEAGFSKVGLRHP